LQRGRFSRIGREEFFKFLANNIFCGQREFQDGPDFFAGAAEVVDGFKFFVEEDLGPGFAFV
jgi:hypothetical protein